MLVAGWRGTRTALWRRPSAERSVPAAVRTVSMHGPNVVCGSDAGDVLMATLNLDLDGASMDAARDEEDTASLCVSECCVAPVRATSVALSPDGALLATGGQDGEVALWERVSEAYTGDAAWEQAATWLFDGSTSVAWAAHDALVVCSDVEYWSSKIGGVQSVTSNVYGINWELTPGAREKRPAPRARPAHIRHARPCRACAAACAHRPAVRATCARAIACTRARAAHHA
jgi:hypothetical protein